MADRSQVLGIVAFAVLGSFFLLLQELPLVLRILIWLDQQLSRLSGPQSPPFASEKEHQEPHYIHYLVGGLAALAEVLAVIYSVSAVAWLAALLFGAAFWDYAKHKRKTWMVHYATRILVACALAGGTYLLLSRTVAAKEPPQRGSQSEPKLYAVEVFTDSLVGGSWQGDSPFLWVVDPPSSTSAQAVDVLIGLQITNLQSMPAEIEGFSVELKANDGWMPLDYIPFYGADVYMGSVNPGSVSVSNAAQINVYPADMETALRGRTMNPGIPVRAVGFFRYSTAIKSVPPDRVVRFRIRILDVAGHSTAYEVVGAFKGFEEFKTPVTTLNYVMFTTTGKFRDLTQLHLNQ